MWSLVPRTTQILIIVALGIVSATLAAWLVGAITGRDQAPYFFIAIAASAISFLFIPLAEITWRHLWRATPALNRMLFPDLNGTWAGEAVPAVNGDGVGEPRPVTVWIRQGLFGVTVSLESDQLASHSTRAVVEVDRQAHTFRIRYAYDGRPPPELAKTNPRHEGVACLEIDPARAANVLTGRYFTDRHTAGRLSLKRRSRRIVPAVSSKS